MGTASSEALRSLQVITDPSRWSLLTELASSDRRVGELSALLDEPQSLVSYHLGALRKAGLVSSRRSSFDGRDAYYRIDLDRCGDVLCAAGAAIDPALTLAVTPPPATGRRPKPKVLFLCTGNSARSQMAEALLQAGSGGAIDARSAGSHPKVLHPNAVRVMAERGIDIAGRPTKHLDRFVRTRFDRVVTVCDKVREVCPEFPGAPIAAHWSVPDPAAAGAADDESCPAFEAVAAELEIRVRHLIGRMTAEERVIHA